MKNIIRLINNILNQVLLWNICCVGIFLVDTLGWESVFKQNEEEESEQSYNFYSQIPIIFNEFLCIVRHTVMLNLLLHFLFHEGSMWRICWHRECKMELPNYIPASTEWLMLANHMLVRFKLVSLLPSRYIFFMLVWYECGVFFLGFSLLWISRELKWFCFIEC
jgi:hypothetical protein